jgi:arabinose-5-phosphate isomerase
MTADALMTRNPRTTRAESLAIDAFKRMEESQITSLFVVEQAKPERLLGLIRMHDLLAAKIV